MQIGDPKKTFPLLIVAILAIGFCIKQVLPGGGGPKALREAPAAGGAAPMPGGSVAMLQLDQLRTDPFSHPKLAPHVPTPATTPNPNPTPSLGTDAGSPLPGPFQPGGTTSIVKDPPGSWPNPLNPGQAPQTGGSTDPVKVEKITEITLKAIVKVNQRLAYLSVDGQEARAFRAGDLIKDDIQVAFVNDDSVIVKSSKNTVTLKVGQQGDLK